ncbi:MAG TPA: hypothetical protein VFX45_12310 [Solirubrobacterales bacterium]|nr:hypothetical protein [Solirubrobacterales bacterium]
MRKRFALGVVAAALAGCTFGTSGALAATQFGDGCVANAAESIGPVTLFELSAPANPLPQAAPVSGVLTSWRISLIPEVPVVIPTTLKVIRANPAAKTAVVIGEGSGNVASGTNQFNTRIPIQAGDRLGISGDSKIGALYCNGAPPSVIGAMLNSFPGLGPTPFEEESRPLRVPIVGLIEPDVDGDGYGDETQDGCPQSAAYHTPCPVITLDTINLVGRKAATILVASSLTAPVSVSGTVKIGKGTTTQLKAGPQTVAPGQLIRFKLNFPTALKKRLKELKPKQKLTLNVTASATNITGSASTDKSNVKLGGQG